jgi:hypothetical protein
MENRAILLVESSRDNSLIACRTSSDYSSTIRGLFVLFADYSYYSSTIRGLFVLFFAYSRTIRTIRWLFADYSYYSSTIRTIRTIRFTILVLSIAVSEFSTLRSRKGTFLHYCLPSFSSVNIKSTVCRNRLGLPNVAWPQIAAVV